MRNYPDDHHHAKPPQFSTLTGPDWGRALVAARARRAAHKNIISAQVHAITTANAKAQPLSLFR